MNFSLFPRVVHRTKTKISGEIVVKKHLGRHSLHVQGLIQSGGIVKGIWQKPIRKVAKVSQLSKVPRVLVLGLGGGTVVQLIKQYWPEAKIVGVEIDPEIVRVGKKYFGLSKVTDLRVMNADVFKWVAKERSQFDLVIVDLYLGGRLPAKVAGDQFLRRVARLLAPSGLAVFNWLKSEASPTNFEPRLAKHFGQVDKIATTTNLFFLIQH